MAPGKIVFGSNDKFGCINDGKVTLVASAYQERYNRNREEIQAKKAWKTQGSSAQFQGVAGQQSHFDGAQTQSKINGLAVMGGLDKVIYAITVNEMSGIFIKDLLDVGAVEGHVVHDSNVDFMSIDYDESQHKLIAGIRVSAYNCHIGTVNMANGHYQVITEGDCLDENPTWSKTQSRLVFYDSCGLARNQHSGIERSAKSICSLDLVSGDLKEIVTDPNQRFDYVKPKEDRSGNLYYIKRPRKEVTKPQTSLLDVAKMPGKVGKAVFGWLDFFTMRYSGDTLKSGGNSANPAKPQQKTPEQLFIEGNLINVQETMAQYKEAGEKYDGAVPRNWELVMQDRSGAVTVISRGVLDYALGDDGQVIYSNGKYIMLQVPNGAPKVLGTVDVATSLSFCAN